MTDLSRRFFTAAGISAALSALSGCQAREGTRMNTALPPQGPVPFPLRVEPGKRHLIDGAGQPFLLHGDTPWSIEVQLTREQISSYLEDRRRRGFTAIMFEAIEHRFNSKLPPWRNAEGNFPFAYTGRFAERIGEYWELVDHVVTQANSHGIACLLFPAYLGYRGGEEGWTAEVIAATADELRDYGRWLAARYRQHGIVWCLGGDYAGEQHPGLLRKQWSIAEGIRTVDPAAVITAHGGRGQSAYSAWTGFAGLNLNNIYTSGLEYELAAVEYARPEGAPFFLIEGRYDGDGATPADCRRQAYVTLLSGGCGHMFGNTPLWGFGEPNSNGGGGPASALITSLQTPATVHMQLVKQFFASIAWWLLQPRTDASLVTTNLGSGSSRICPALASDRSFAVVWTVGGDFTVDLSALASATVRARWYHTQTGAYEPVPGSPFASGGAHSFSAPGERLLILD